MSEDAAPWYATLARWFGQQAEDLQAQAEASQRQLQAEARLLAAEVRQLGGAFWERIDALPFTPEKTRFSPVVAQFYGHGAFMGAAPALLADPTWRRILAFLMPDVFEAVFRRVDEGADPATLMTMLENNPVLSAFGTLQAAEASSEDEHPNHLAGMEWDVFVDSALVDAFRAAATRAERDAVMDQVIDTALIAHAGAVDTIQENLGISQYHDVRNTPKTEFGGVEMDAWLDLFGRALTLARAEDFGAAVAAMAAEPRSASNQECMRHTFQAPWSLTEVVEIHRQVTGREYLSIIVDMKSLYSTADFLGGLVQRLNHFGVHVAAVGSFIREEIDGVGSVPQQLGELSLPPAREVLFFHLAGDLQAAGKRNLLRRGDSVMFNGASLLDVSTSTAGTHRYSVRQRVVRQLDALRQHWDLRIGFYVQEGDCEAAAAGLLSDLVDAWPETFHLGFAWGGLRDEAALPSGQFPRMGYGSQGYLLLIGKARMWQLDEE